MLPSSFGVMFVSETLRLGVFYSSSIVRVIKARRMRWAGHVARMGELRGCIQHFDWEA
jgi:hypothetical protein